MRLPNTTPRPKAILPWAAGLALLASCSSPMPPPLPLPTPAPPTAPTSVIPVSPPALPPAPAAVIDPKFSQASTARDYRKDAASHLYAANQTRVYPGMMPPLLHAVGVLQVEIDNRGNVTGMNWIRAPLHAPDVMAEIERSVRQAAPFPVPVRMGKVTYTDTWLWHSSGRFQLDTLTEGQL